LPSAIAAAVPPAQLESAIERLDANIVDADTRKALLARSFELRSGREKPNRFWKVDLDALDFSGLNVAPYQTPAIMLDGMHRASAFDILTASTEHKESFSRAFGAAVRHDASKFAALTAALCNTGAFVYVPADVAVDEPIQITYDAGNAAIFPYTLVVLERGAQATVIERVTGAAGAFVCGITEIVTAENAHVTYASEQTLPDDARIFMTRAAKPGKDATVVWSVADIGAQLAVGSVDVIVDNPGIDAQINGLFFPREDQHVDLISTVEHNVGDSQSQTLIKSAATGRGQARYLGNIRIAPHAQATESALRDDALLLSKRAHIDSVPALEIAANDVKAYHGATVGALDEEQIFYMTSRGIAREDAEKMIALGFFEPVVARFPTEALRAQLREALQTKVTA
jgi:Fe-S cluster assembly protein SufD